MRNLPSGTKIIYLIIMVQWEALEGNEWSKDNLHDQKSVCENGWTGPSCQWCIGKRMIFSKSGFIEGDQSNISSDLLSTECAWLIDGNSALNQSNQTYISFQVEKFKTKCENAYLYINDGKSAHYTRLTVYRGGISHIRNELIVATSGHAFVYYKSHIKCPVQEYKIAYVVDYCPTDKFNTTCSGNGKCSNGHCKCEPGYEGDACHIKARSTCNEGQQENNEITGGKWEVVERTHYPVNGFASHASVVWKNILFILGGKSYTESSAMTTYNFNTRMWNKSYEFPLQRYGHSAVMHNGTIYMYGGKISTGGISNELWSYNVLKNRWKIVKLTNRAINIIEPLNATFHTASYINDIQYERMVIIFGSSPKYPYFLTEVQEYRFDTNTWKIVETNGYPVPGRAGHTSTYDPITRRIYVFGGFLSSNKICNKLYSYDPDSHQWLGLNSAPNGRVYHSALILDGLMVIYGGLTNETEGKKILLSYDLACDAWFNNAQPSCMPSDIDRHGHSAIEYKDSMYIFGGCNGRIQNYMFRYKNNKCANITNKKDCQMEMGAKCIWDRVQGSCISYKNTTHKFIRNYDMYCSSQKRTLKSLEAQCSELQLIETCLNTSLGCEWYPFLNKCSHESKSIPEVICFNNKCLNFIEQETELKPKYCSDIKDCSTCSNISTCIWCDVEQKCFSTNVSQIFSFGLCDKWINQPKLCNSQCGIYSSCAECVHSTMCGWCEHDSRTGLGTCMRGGNGPHSICLPEYWNFSSCPTCQCNGQSTCNQNGKCRACGGTTVGLHCEHCKLGYYGNPTNGGSCKACKCNNQAHSCNRIIGSCHCNTKGIIGKYCEKCDTNNNFVGNPIHGTCYYNLHTNKNATITIDKHEKQYEQINFKFKVIKENVEIRFQMFCTSNSMVQVTKQIAQHSESEYGNYICTRDKSIRFRDFEINNTLTYYVYVFNFKPPFTISMGFLQYTEEQIVNQEIYFNNKVQYCNGHSNLTEHGLCIQPCLDNTRGKNCEFCSVGYYGDATFGGTCKRCQCNNHATTCDSMTGDCHCQTFGIIGDQCELCDGENNFYGNSTLDTCYYILPINKTVIFNVTKDERYFRKINFQYTIKPNVNAKIQIKASTDVTVSVTELKDMLETERKRIRKKGQEINKVLFVREGVQPRKGAKQEQGSILDKAATLEMRADLGRQLKFPYVIQTNLHPNIVIWSVSQKCIIIVELTVPWEEGCEEAAERKTSKYVDLVRQCRDQDWRTWFFTLEVGCRGFPGHSVWKLLAAIGLTRRRKKTAARKLGEAAERASCWLWHKREDME